MKYYINYIIMTKERIAMRMIESYDNKRTANERYVELKKTGFCFDFKTRIEPEANDLYTVDVHFQNKGMTYTYLVPKDMKIDEKNVTHAIVETKDFVYDRTAPDSVNCWREPMKFELVNIVQFKYRTEKELELPLDKYKEIRGVLKIA